MSSREKTYTGKDIAVMVPTKDRLEKMKNLLESLVDQSEPCGRVIVVASGESIEDVVLSFADQLPVEYFHSTTGGQIHQRNIAISKLDDRTPLVISFDDDIVLEPGALKTMVSFWNQCAPNTAGVSFNIINNPPYRYSWMKAIIGMSSQKQGRVLRSGYNVATSPVTTDIKAEWLCGGATVWRKEILLQHRHTEIASRWAICEDVLFSYPIGKKYPLYICANARVRHEHVFDHTAKKKYHYYGKTITLWRLFFVESHPELSRLVYTWMVLGQIMARLGTGTVLFRSSELQYAYGQLEGLIVGLAAVFRGKNLPALLEEDGQKRSKG